MRLASRRMLNTTLMIHRWIYLSSRYLITLFSLRRDPYNLLSNLYACNLENRSLGWEMFTAGFTVRHVAEFLRSAIRAREVLTCSVISSLFLRRTRQLVRERLSRVTRCTNTDNESGEIWPAFVTCLIFEQFAVAEYERTLLRQLKSSGLIAGP